MRAFDYNDDYYAENPNFKYDYCHDLDDEDYVDDYEADEDDYIARELERLFYR